MGSRIVATGRAVPKTAVSNHDLERILDTSDEWIRTRTGIGSRYVMREGESLAEIGAQACAVALERAGVKPQELDAIIAGTVSSELAFPSFGCQLQQRLGADSIPAFDVAAACSGFVYGLSIADSMMRTGEFRRVLVVGADALSTFIDWNDRNTAVLFGDGAGAGVLVSEPGSRGVLASLLRSSGQYGELLYCRAECPRGTMDSRLRRDPELAIKMKGTELFKMAVKSMEDVSRQVAERSRVALEDVDIVVGHQANRRIITAVAERLGIPMEKVFINIDRYGNTSAASVPIALDEALEQGRIREGDLVMLNACGAGLTWGANLIRW